MSFREYLEFEGIYKRDAISLEQLLANHVTIATQITSKIKVLPLFEQYLKYGCYPFYKRDSIEFESRLQEVINQILYTDLPAVEDVSFATIQKTRRLLMILAERVPQTPKMTELYNALESSREQGLKMLYALERASLINLITTEPNIIGKSKSHVCAFANRRDRYNKGSFLRKPAFCHSRSTISKQRRLLRQSQILVRSWRTKEIF